jgi:hypothetical protein
MSTAADAHGEPALPAPPARVPPQRNFFVSPALYIVKDLILKVFAMWVIIGIVLLLLLAVLAGIDLAVSALSADDLSKMGLHR